MINDNPEDFCLDRPLDEIWAKACELLVKRVKDGGSVKLKGPGFLSWVRPATLLELSADEAVVAVYNDFGRTKLGKEYCQDIETVLQEILGRKVSLRVVLQPSAIKTNEYMPTIAAITVMPETRSFTSEKTGHVYETAVRAGGGNHNLNPKQVFDTFVVGSSNRFSHAAAQAVAEKPGQAYNPLFLYGGVGLGKTHLLHAIGNAILQRAPHTVIRYLSCEKFTNEVINAIREQKTPELRKRYRQVDLLLMDDIQFLEGKESTLEEFFHTFNHLRDAGKQIVLSSDRPPKSLTKLPERLRSRFEWGLIGDIQAPDYEMRLAILRKKAEFEKVNVSDGLLDQIANTVTGNIRELEGALVRANAYASLLGESLTAASVSQVLQPGLQRKDRPVVTVDRIIDTVCSYYRVEPADIRSARRSQDLAIPRHIAMYLTYKIMSLSYPRVGQAFGNRKHTSVIYACDKIKIAISEDHAIADAVREITRQLDD